MIENKGIYAAYDWSDCFRFELAEKYICLASPPNGPVISGRRQIPEQKHHVHRADDSFIITPSPLSRYKVKSDYRFVSPHALICVQ